MTVDRCRRPARLGYFACQAARLVGPRGLVARLRADALERRDAELLTANVWRNGFTNVVCFPWAVGMPRDSAGCGLGEQHRRPPPGEGGELWRHRDRPCRGARRIARAFRAGRRREARRPGLRVRGRPRDASSCSRLRPSVLVVVELSPADARAAGTEPRELLAYYRSLGFGIRVQLPDEKGLLDALGRGDSRPSSRRSSTSTSCSSDRPTYV